MDDLFEHFSRSYGWTPQQIGKLTFDQVTMYLGASLGPGESKSVRVGGIQEARKMLDEINDKKENG